MQNMQWVKKNNNKCLQNQLSTTVRVPRLEAQLGWSLMGTCSEHDAKAGHEAASTSSSSKSPSTGLAHSTTY